VLYIGWVKDPAIIQWTRTRYGVEAVEQRIIVFKGIDNPYNNRLYQLGKHRMKENNNSGSIDSWYPTIVKRTCIQHINGFSTSNLHGMCFLNLHGLKDGEHGKGFGNKDAYIIS
jgi:hypothetical protein